MGTAADATTWSISTARNTVWCPTVTEATVPIRATMIAAAEVPAMSGGQTEAPMRKTEATVLPGHKPGKSKSKDAHDGTKAQHSYAAHAGLNSTATMYYCVDEEEDISLQPLLPFVGMQFDTVEDARIFYNEYAFKTGFGIHIDASRNSQNKGPTTLIKRGFECVHTDKPGSKADSSTASEGLSIGAASSSNDSSFEMDVTNKRQKNRCINNSDTVDEFEENWQHMIHFFELVENGHLCNMWRTYHTWVPAFFRKCFFPFTSTTRRSEGLNSYFKTFVHPQDSVWRFVQQYEMLQETMLDREDNQAFIGAATTTPLYSRYKIERQAVGFYTFSKFEAEVAASIGFVLNQVPSVDIGGVKFELLKHSHM
ncbi:protein far1-related sequence 5 [Hordeum vulgare]|nr:protein far1-related sequence 5 [Hordeum vulgare]